MNFFNLKSNKGFTLIEMIVSIAIFMIVALVAIGAFLKTIDLNAKSHTLKDAMSNINFALDSMSRELRTGTNYYCPTSPFTLNSDTNLPSSNCTNDSFLSNWYIYFYSQKTANRLDGTKCRLVHAYRFVNNTIEKAEQQTCSESINQNSISFTNSIISKTGITFTKATIRIVRDTSNIYAVPFLQFNFAGSVGTKEKTKTYFNFQTGVSQRVSD